MYERILVRYGDLTLKGKNKRFFVKQANKLVKEKVKSDKVSYERNHDRLYIKLNGEDPQVVIDGLNHVSGLSSYSLIKKVDTDLETIKKESLAILKQEITQPGILFKVDVKRADKTYPMISPEVTKELAKYVLRRTQGLIVDVHNPELVLNVEIRREGAYIYCHKIKGMGGYPVGMGGKGLLMMSGGIDSPVAAFQAMKQGIDIDLIHFESTPLTSIESAQKVIDLAKKLSVYAPGNTIKLHMVPFEEMHQALLNHVHDSYQITIMRRMMYRIAEQFANNHDHQVIINGDSVGQVASQTLESMTVVNNVIKMPILRPLATTDKLDIIAMSKDIDCYDISIRPFEDCCTVYVPKSPITKPRENNCLGQEEGFDYQSIIERIIPKIKTIDVTENLNLDLTVGGFTVQNAL
ncbi:MAG: tRNA uracil 4-sulfurtransferase ThiI [Candidatus Izemoplasma sp.]|nr:tRNA uracil 4-sulfurtransferase ThiI [Candidatus Izemoplasma sp.]